jgi:hypothetical protein
MQELDLLLTFYLSHRAEFDSKSREVTASALTAMA